MSYSSVEQDTVLLSGMSDMYNASSETLVNHIYTADTLAHVFDGTLYTDPSHDYESGIPQDDLGSHFDM